MDTYIDSYKEMYSTIGGSFKIYLENDKPYLLKGWISDNFDIGYYYTSNAFLRIRYDLAVLELVQYNTAKDINLKDDWIRHIELMKDFYDLKGTTYNELVIEMRNLIKDVHEKLPKYNN